MNDELESRLIVLQIVFDAVVDIGNFRYVEFETVVAQFEILFQFAPTPGHQLPSLAVVQHTV